MCSNYNVIESEGWVIIKVWIKGVLFEDKVQEQLSNIVSMLLVYFYIVVMFDVYMGKGVMIGSVILFVDVVIFVVVGVDSGCGMVVIKIILFVSQLLDNLLGIRSVFEVVILYGRSVRVRGL